MIANLKYRIIKKVVHNSGVVELGFDAPEIADYGLPGQFVNIQVSEKLPHPFLRRPISIHDITVNGEVCFLIKKVGTGTKMICDSEIGDELSLIGPSGKPFTMPNANCTPVLIAGGIGIAPIYFLLNRLLNEGFEPLLFYGAGTSSEILKKKELISSCKVYFATDDGSFAKQGMVSELLPQHIFENSGEFCFYACGPQPMFKSLAPFMKSHNFPCEISAEENMACGIGACYGCSLKTKDGYKRVCKDGPIFELSDIFEEQ
ncbi:dihydroorotate dehydrogenase electron transfer subunit [bacterium]|nr:dihydroorotate dehydrogenase electron transfer subunit [bacterium]